MDKKVVHIISKSIKGDEKAQRQLYELHRTRWYMISMRYGKNKMEAEDIFQEGLIGIYKDLHQYNNKKASFNTWSSRVLINAALRYLKKNNWMSSLRDLEPEMNTADENEMILDQIASKELTHMIQKLPIGYRLVFNLFALEGYSHKEIANKLGIAEGTSKSQLSKARKQLRAILESQLKITKP